VQNIKLPLMITFIILGVLLLALGLLCVMKSKVAKKEEVQGLAGKMDFKKIDDIN